MSEYNKVKDMLLEELSKIDFPLAKSRHNIVRGGITREGFVLGKVFNWGDGLKRDPRTFRPSNRTKAPKFRNIWLLSNKLMKLHDPDFKYTSIQYNKNNRTARHQDANNTGISNMIGLGDYTGGDLLVYDEDGKNPKAYKTKDKWIKFDGSKYPHETMAFKGDRYTLVYYNAGDRGFKK
jgi:hypothetical protein